MYALLVVLLSFILCEANSAALTFFSVTSSLNGDRIPSISPLRVLKLPFVSCHRQCVMDSNCWSWYVYSANGSDNCVLLGANLCLQPSLIVMRPVFTTKWWEKLSDFPLPCVARNVSATSTLSQPLSTTASTIPTLTIIPTTQSSSTNSSTSATTSYTSINGTTSTVSTITSTDTSTSTNSTVSSTSTTQSRPTCTATTCKTCQDCFNIQGGSPGPALIQTTNVIMCTLWPNGTNGISVTLPCFDGGKAALFYRKVEFNTTNVTEFLLTPEQMHWIHKTHYGSNLEIRFRYLAQITDVKVLRYSNFAISPLGELSLGSYVGYYVDIFGAPIVNAPFVNNLLVNPACGPFWNLSSSLVASYGTAFNATPCPGYPTALYGQPGFYNNKWSSGMSGPFSDVILEMLIFQW